MELTFSVVIALACLNVFTAKRHTELATGRDRYQAGDFKKAASQSRVLSTHGKAEACDPPGASYERLADIRMPFRRPLETKAQQYLPIALDLAPGLRWRRDALREFPLNMDCLRTAPAEAETILVRMPDAGPELDWRRRRLEEQRRVRASSEARLDAPFLSLPRAACWRVLSGGAL